MDKFWAIYVLDAESHLYSEGVGLPIPTDMADAVVATVPELAEGEYGHVPSIRQALDRRKATVRVIGVMTLT